MIPGLVGEGEGRQEKGRFSSQCHCGWWELNPTRELWENPEGHLTRATGIRDYLPTPFSHLWRAACQGGVLLLELQLSAPNWVGFNCQREPTGSWNFGHCAVVYKRIQVTSATVAFPPPALSLDLWKLLSEWCIVLLISKPIQYCPTTSKTAALKCDLCSNVSISPIDKPQKTQLH